MVPYNVCAICSPILDKMALLALWREHGPERPVPSILGSLIFAEAILGSLLLVVGVMDFLVASIWRPNPVESPQLLGEEEVLLTHVRYIAHPIIVYSI